MDGHCTLTFAFGRSFLTDEDEREDMRSEIEDYLIPYDVYQHHDAYAFMDRIEDGKHDRILSDTASIWVRASSVPEADETPK